MKMFKRTILSAVCCIISIAAHAQFDDVRKGDIIDINGVKALVFQVDAEGHGTAMTVKALRGKKNAWCTNAKLLKNLGATSSPDGMQNTKTVYDYINSSGFSVSQFPAFEWCQKLGSGWYIPSREEMEVFVNYYLGNEQEFDWESEEEFDIDSQAVTPKEINEKLIEAGGVPFLGNAIPGSGLAIGVYTSTKTADNKVFIYQYNTQKNTFRFKGVPTNMIDAYAIGRAFYKF